MCVLSVAAARGPFTARLRSMRPSDGKRPAREGMAACIIQTKSRMEGLTNLAPSACRQSTMTIDRPCSVYTQCSGSPGKGVQGVKSREGEVQFHRAIGEEGRRVGRKTSIAHPVG